MPQAPGCAVRSAIAGCLGTTVDAMHRCISQMGFHAFLDSTSGILLTSKKKQSMTFAVNSIWHAPVRVRSMEDCSVLDEEGVP